MNIKGITVSVNYDDLLEITLVRNARHLTEIVVVTTEEDKRTQAVVASVPNARCFITDAFTRYGARFNKSLALEEGFDFIGREGWILIFDADTLFPESMPLPKLEVGKLYTPTRILLEDPTQWTEDYNWNKAKLSNDRHFPGYYQLFHANDPAINTLPWYDVTFAHAGGGDGYFQSRWHPTNKIRPTFQVLHLGPRDQNWHGRVSPRVDGAPIEQSEENRKAMEQFLKYKGWNFKKEVIPNYSEVVPVPEAKTQPWVH